MTNQHFQGKYEVELKYRLDSKSTFLSALKSLPHEVMLKDNQECDWYFDTADRTLHKQNKSLCVRTMEPSGINLWIVKGPESDRCEATNITDSAKARSMLETMGYEVVLTAKKRRSIYFVQQFHITVDSLAELGDFAEFAVMTDDKSLLAEYRINLAALAAKLGLTPTSLETRSYRQLLQERT